MIEIITLIKDLQKRFKIIVRHESVERKILNLGKWIPKITHSLMLPLKLFNLQYCNVVITK